MKECANRESRAAMVDSIGKAESFDMMADALCLSDGRWVCYEGIHVWHDSGSTVPWFLYRDVIRELGILDECMWIDFLYEDEKMLRNVEFLGADNETVMFISKSAFYLLILQLKKTNLIDSNRLRDMIRDKFPHGASEY